MSMEILDGSHHLRIIEMPARRLGRYPRLNSESILKIWPSLARPCLPCIRLLHAIANATGIPTSLKR